MTHSEEDEREEWPFGVHVPPPYLVLLEAALIGDWNIPEGVRGGLLAIVEKLKVEVGYSWHKCRPAEANVLPPIPRGG